jgi:hypothetical protein
MVDSLQTNTLEFKSIGFALEDVEPKTINDFSL